MTHPTVKGIDRYYILLVDWFNTNLYKNDVKQVQEIGYISSKSVRYKRDLTQECWCGPKLALSAKTEFDLFVAP